LIRAESVPFRPHRGIYVVVEEGSGSDADAHEAALMDVDGVAGLWAFGSGDASDSHPWQPGDDRITVAWLDAEPNEVAAALAPIERSRTGVTFAGPFETITPWEWSWFDATD